VFPLPRSAAIYVDRNLDCEVTFRDPDTGVTTPFFPFPQLVTPPSEPAVLVDAKPGEQSAVIRQLEENSPGDGQCAAPGTVVLPLFRNDGTLIGVLVASPLGGRSVGYHRRPPTVADLPFLQLLAKNAQSGACAAELRAELRASADVLERRVVERTSELEALNQRLEDSLQQLRDTQSELVTASRLAGMSEIATGVLHNVGNVLNSVNVSTTVTVSKVRAVPHHRIRETAALLSAKGDDPVVRDRVVRYLDGLGQRYEADRDETLDELARLRDNIEHIRTIVATQQSYARAEPVLEECAAAQLLRDAVTMHRGTVEALGIDVSVVADPGVVVNTDRHKVLQILINLVTNSIAALADVSGARRLMLEAQAAADQVGLTVLDTGVGIDADTLPRIFAHGFTTKANGHGFGLHSAAVAARELGGSLAAESAGRGRGARFVLTLPRRGPHGAPHPA
jgi:two-component system NtrC family sensor kinase